jgi:hypothetical protein
MSPATTSRARNDMRERYDGGRRPVKLRCKDEGSPY